MDTPSNRILGRVLAVEEMNTVSGAWTLAADHDTSKSTDTGAHQVDTTAPSPFSESINLAGIR